MKCAFATQNADYWNFIWWYSDKVSVPTRKVFRSVLSIQFYLFPFHFIYPRFCLTTNDIVYVFNVISIVIANILYIFLTPFCQLHFLWIPWGLNDSRGQKDRVPLFNTDQFPVFYVKSRIYRMTDPHLLDSIIES